jgi:hypothetical protein
MAYVVTYIRRGHRPVTVRYGTREEAAAFVAWLAKDADVTMVRLEEAAPRA